MSARVKISLCASCDRVILTIGGIRFETQAQSLAQAIAIAAHTAHDLGIGTGEIAVLPESDEDA